MAMTDSTPIVAMRGISKSFGQVQALNAVDLEIGRAELVGIVGHNGAGKSTLMGVLRGTIARGEGSFAIDGRAVPASYDVREARRRGIRSVFQEPSLCPTLSVIENTRLAHRKLRGWGWSDVAGRVIGQSLDAIFPGHAISPHAIIGDLPAGSRQMVEIARAFSVLSEPPRLVILDEPTSALDAQVAAQFLDYIGRARRSGVSCLLISHRLKEIVDHTDRVVVMRDGRVVDERTAEGLSPEQLVEAMGVMARTEEGDGPRGAVQKAQRDAAVAPAPGDVARVRQGGAPAGEISFKADAREFVGLAGLDGHGQREQLLAIFRSANGQDDRSLNVDGKVAYVSGDRHREGVFPLWSISSNLSIGLIKTIARFGLIKLADEESAAKQWRSHLGIKTPDVHAPILSLSGGNQQKVLIARALAGDADIILLDDPMRGVDVSSKREMFERIRQEVDDGKCFVLYTTETEELTNCDRVYVFYQGVITAEIPRSALSEERVLAASFGRVLETAGAAVSA
jgi:ribose transport system ATP-binding protein